jgi:hypothetical protein
LDYVLEVDGDTTMSETALATKLQVKPGFKMVVINAPEGYLKMLDKLPEGTEVTTKGSGTFDFVQVFVCNKADVDSLAAKAIKAVKPGGMLWFAYPKKTGKIKTDIHRDYGWDAVYNAGWEGVRLISVDDTWSAMRFRPTSEIKSRK